MAGFYLGTLLIGSFSPILAFGLMQMEGTAGIRGWRWIFIIEGVLTCAIALVAFFTVIDFPDKVLEKRNGRFLTAEDVAMIKARIDRDRDDSVADPITWSKVGKHLSDFKLWVLFVSHPVPPRPRTPHAGDVSKLTPDAVRCCSCRRRCPRTRSHTSCPSSSREWAGRPRRRS